jgi:hypothetical protein
VNFETVTAANADSGTQRMTPNIVGRVFDDSQKRETFAVSNEVGIAIVPLRPGNYCFEAFDHEGHSLTLDKTQSRCFDLKRAEYPTIGVVLSKNGE